MRHSLALPVSDPSQVGDARRVTARFTSDLGLSEQERGTVALIVTELGNNLAKYAQDGQLVIRALTDERENGIEILSLDSGPGFADIAKRVADGYSSGGTPGNGLGAVQRLSTRFEVYSSVGVGTAIMSRISSPASNAVQSAERLEFGVVCVPIKGEEKCGDSWGVRQDASHAVFTLVDGLGHGIIAATAADEAIRIFGESHDRTATEILETVHQGLRSTRGAVMAVAELNWNNSQVSYAGVGNIAGCLIENGQSKHMVSMNGTVGLAAKPRSYPYQWEPNAVLVLHSDGLQTRWQLELFPGLFHKHPSLIAGVLFQNYCRGRDDACVMAARWTR